MSEPAADWFTASEAADSLGITARAFRAWEVEPVAEIGKRRFFDAASIIANRIEAMTRRRRRPETTVEELKVRVDALETNLMRERAETQRVRNAEARGELVTADRLTQAIATACTRCAAILEPLPGKIKRARPTLNSSVLHAVQKIIARRRNEAAELTLQDIDYWSKWHARRNEKSHRRSRTRRSSAIPPRSPPLPGS